MNLIYFLSFLASKSIAPINPENEAWGIHEARKLLPRWYLGEYAEINKEWYGVDEPRLTVVKLNQHRAPIPINHALQFDCDRKMCWFPGSTNSENAKTWNQSTLGQNWIMCGSEQESVGIWKARRSTAIMSSRSVPVRRMRWRWEYPHSTDVKLLLSILTDLPRCYVNQ